VALGQAPGECRHRARCLSGSPQQTPLRYQRPPPPQAAHILCQSVVVRLVQALLGRPSVRPVRASSSARRTERAKTNGWQRFLHRMPDEVARPSRSTSPSPGADWAAPLPAPGQSDEFGGAIIRGIISQKGEREGGLRDRSRSARRLARLLLRSDPAAGASLRKTCVCDCDAIRPAGRAPRRRPRRHPAAVLAGALWK
jgi:hypothetical protein